MAAWGYGFYLLVLKVCLTSERILSPIEDKIRIPARPCNILYLPVSNELPIMVYQQLHHALQISRAFA